MTKRAIVGALCILAALTLGVWGEVYLRGASEKLLAAAALPPHPTEEQLFSAAGNAVALWQNEAPLLGALVKHSDADALAGIFFRLRQWRDAGDAVNTEKCLRECCAALRALLAGERLMLENVLLINAKFFS